MRSQIFGCACRKLQPASGSARRLDDLYTQKRSYCHSDGYMTDVSGGWDRDGVGDPYEGQRVESRPLFSLVSSRSRPVSILIKLSQIRLED